MKLSELSVNPKNPRIIKDDKFKKLVESVKKDPEFMETHQIGVKNGVIMAGNMRYRALLELNYKEIPDKWVVDISKWSDEKIRRYVVIDNLGYGEWDWDILSSDYDAKELLDWGFDDYILKLDEDVDTDKMWEGMPDFESKEDAFKSLLVHFERQEDVDMFAKLIGQTITDKTKYVWYPRKEKENIKSMEIKGES